MKEVGDGNPAFIYTCIWVNDMDESIVFYTRVLNMTIAEKRERTEPTKGEVITLKSRHSGQLLELNWYAADCPYCPEYRNGEGLDHLAFEVDDIRPMGRRTAYQGSEDRNTPGGDRRFHRMEGCVHQGSQRHLDRVPPEEGIRQQKAVKCR